MYNTLTAKLYQAGMELNIAVSKGADKQKFMALENEFKGGSIPMHLLHGFKKTEPYSCDYHTGGKVVEQFRSIVKEMK